MTFALLLVCIGSVFAPMIGFLPVVTGCAWGAGLLACCGCIVCDASGARIVCALFGMVGPPGGVACCCWTGMAACCCCCLALLGVGAVNIGWPSAREGASESGERRLMGEGGGRRKETGRGRGGVRRSCS